MSLTVDIDIRDKSILKKLEPPFTMERIAAIA